MSTEFHLREVLKGKEATLSAYKSWNKTLQEENATLKQSRNGSIANSTPASTAEIERMSKELEDVKRERDGLKLQVKMKRETVKGMEEEMVVKRMRAEDSELERVRKTRELKEKVKELEAEKDGLVRERNAMIEERDKMRGERDAMRFEMDGMKAIMYKMRSDGDELRTKLKETRDGLEGEADALRKEVQAERAERASVLAQKDASLGRLSSERDALSREVKSLQKDHTTVEAENVNLAAALEMQMKTMNDDAASSARRIGELEKRALEARDQVTALRKEVRVVENERNALRQSAGVRIKVEDVDFGAGGAVEPTNLVEELRDTQIRCDGLATKLSDAEHTAERLRTELVQAVLKATASQTSEVNLREKVAIMQANVEMCTKELDESRREAAALREALQTSDGRMQDLERRLDDKVDEIDRLKDEIYHPGRGEYRGGGSKRPRLQGQSSEYGYVSAPLSQFPKDVDPARHPQRDR